MPKEQFERFSGFQALGAIKLESERDLKERFEACMKDKLDTIPAGNYKTQLPGVDSISITHPLPQYAKDLLNVTLIYSLEPGKQRLKTARINNRGNISGDIPKELIVSEDDIKREVIRIVETIDTTFWHATKLQIFPEQDEAARKLGETGVEAGQKEVKGLIDPERLPFIENQQHALFGFYNEEDGFKGYRVTVFPTFIVVECELKGNAAFVVDLPEKLDIDPSTWQLPASKRVSDKDAQEIARRIWSPIAQAAKTRKQIVEMFGAERIEHKGESETWKSRIQFAIDKRTGKIENIPEKAVA
jgi:hypothetical protein